MIPPTLTGRSTDAHGGRVLPAQGGRSCLRSIGATVLASFRHGQLGVSCAMPRQWHSPLVCSSTSWHECRHPRSFGYYYWRISTRRSTRAAGNLLGTRSIRRRIQNLESAAGMRSRVLRIPAPGRTTRHRRLPRSRDREDRRDGRQDRDRHRTPKGVPHSASSPLP